MLNLSHPTKLVKIGSVLLVSLGMGIPAVAEPLSLTPGFLPNPIEVRGTAGGTVEAATLVNRPSTPTGECTGFADRKPNHTLTLKAFFNALSIQVRSVEDTAIVIQGPGGVWCNDDEEDKNPGVAGQWLPGTYKIWVTTYAKERSPAYTLRISERR
jgi:hypothetical protein